MRPPGAQRWPRGAAGPAAAAAVAGLLLAPGVDAQQRAVATWPEQHRPLHPHPHPHPQPEPQPQPQPQPAPQFGVFVAPDGQALDLEWHLPAGPAQALVTLQHGFARRCANLRGLAQDFAAEGYATLCINADMARGAPALAAALASALASALAAPPPDTGLQLPDGSALPPRVIVAGHSAGGLFASRVGAGLAERAPGMLAAVLLFDPVGGADLGAALQRVRQPARGGPAPPALALLAPPSRCNAGPRARDALQVALHAAAATVVEVGQGTHLDAEGSDTEIVAVWACREGAPRDTAVRQLRETALAFARAALSAPRP